MMDAAFKLKTQNERAKVEDLFDYEGNAFKLEERQNLTLYVFMKYFRM